MERVLIVIDGPEKGRAFPLEDGQVLVIGRGQASDTKINDPRMSRVHCRLKVDGGDTWLLDAGSSSGTWFGGKQVRQQTLKPGDVFKVGESLFRFQFEAAHEQSTLVEQRLTARTTPQQVVAPLHELIGRTLHGYHLEKIINRGNSGMVFLAHDEKHDRKVAVKVLDPTCTSSDEERQRFVRAMKTMLPIKHENIVRLFNAGKSGPFCWAAMQYVEGRSLAEVIDEIGVQGMLDWRQVWRVGVHMGRALRAACEHKIVHRNVTPANILQRQSDKLYLLGDLMLAKALEGTLAKQVTQAGQLIGDVPYMSPERTRDCALVDGRSDIYGLGATMYALLAGRPPFESNSMPKLVHMVREAEPVKPREFQLSINETFQDVLMRMLAKRPEDRQQTPQELLNELERIGMFNNLKAD